MKPEIRVQLKNHSYIHVSADPSILVELREHFSFRPKGFEWSPKFRSGQWDGYIRLFDARNSTMYAGLYELVEAFANERGYAVTPVFSNYFGWPKTFAENMHETIVQLCSDLQLTSNNKRIEPFDYQIKAVVDALQERRKVILLPTGSGKSLVIYIIIRYLMEHGLIPDDMHIVLVVPTVNLVKQMYSDFVDYSSVNGWNVEDHCQQIFAGQEKEISKKVVITTWQSLIKFPAVFFRKIGAVLGDEAHHFKADSLMRIMLAAVNSPFKISMTGTLDGDKINALTLQGLFGKIQRYASTKELQDRGILAPLKIGILVLKYNDELCRVYSKARYEDEIAYINESIARVHLVKEMAVGLTGNTLVMFKIVEHGKRIYEMIKDRVGDTRKVFLIYGGVGADDRENIRKIVEQEKNAIAVVSVGTFAEGVNIRNITNLINAAPGKSRIKTLQAIGRTLRLSDDGSASLLVDIADNFCYKGKKNHTFRHLEERMKMYAEEEFDYTITEVKL